MAVILTPKLYLAQYDLTGFANQGQPSVDVEKKYRTTFADAGMKRVEAGFETVSLKSKVFWQANSAAFKSHDILASQWKVSDVPVAWCPTTGSAGEACQFFRALSAGYSFAGAIGEYVMADVEATASGSSPNIYGTVLDTGTKSAGGNGTARLLGLVGVTQRLYAALLIFSMTGGGTLTVKVQSDDNVGMSSPTDRITFSGATVAGWQWLELGGAIASDNYWRSFYTLTAGTATFALLVGIL